MKPSTVKLSTVLGIIEPVFYFLLITALSLTRPDYRINKNYISELSGNDTKNHKYINLFSFVILGAVVILYSFALHNNVRKHPLSLVADALLIISGVSIILLGLVPADGKKITARGQWHRRLTFPAAIGFPAAMLCYSVIFKQDKRWKKHWPAVTLLLSNLILATDELLQLKKPKQMIGLVQRLGTGLALFWIFSTSAKMYSLQLNR